VFDFWCGGAGAAVIWRYVCFAGGTRGGNCNLLYLRLKAAVVCVTVITKEQFELLWDSNDI